MEQPIPVYLLALIVGDVKYRDLSVPFIPLACAFTHLTSHFTPAACILTTYAEGPYTCVDRASVAGRGVQ